MVEYTHEEKQRALDEANRLMKSKKERLKDIEEYVSNSYKRFTTPYLNEEDLKFLIEQTKQSLEESND